jgi:hypothetical protein
MNILLGFTSKALSLAEMWGLRKTEGIFYAGKAPPVAEATGISDAVF